MSSNVTIEVQTDSQTTRVVLPLSTIGAAGSDTEANAVAIARLTAHVLKEAAASGATVLDTVISGSSAINQGSNINRGPDPSTTEYNTVQPDQVITVCVRVLANDSELLFEARSSDTVESVMLQIEDEEGLAPADQVLLFMDKMMCKKTTLAEVSVLGQRFYRQFVNCRAERD